MAVSFEKVNAEIIKIARSCGYTVRLYDENGDGPLSSSKDAKYIYLDKDGIMISVPTGSYTEHDEIYVYRGVKVDKANFTTLIQNLKRIGRFNTTGITIRSFDSVKKVSPKHFADEARATRHLKDSK